MQDDRAMAKKEPLVWLIRSTDPYNKIGKHALQDVYAWAGRGLLMYRIKYGSHMSMDTIAICKPDLWTFTDERGRVSCIAIGWFNE